jgi:hypothetical protein
MRLHITGHMASIIVRGHWFAVRFPWMGLLFSERYGGEPRLRILGFRLHHRKILSAPG